MSRWINAPRAYGLPGVERLALERLVRDNARAITLNRVSSVRATYDYLVRLGYAEEREPWVWVATAAGILATRESVAAEDLAIGDILPGRDEIRAITYRPESIACTVKSTNGVLTLRYFDRGTTVHLIEAVR